MRRRDREVYGTDEIFDILNRCDTLRIGISGDKYPYVVPVSFGAELDNGEIVIYFHCAKEGMKLDLINENPNVCIEGDIFIKTEEIKHGITARYESVIGFGRCEFLADEEEMLHGLKVITEHYGYFDYKFDKCGGIHHFLVGRIVVEEITGKRNRKNG
jgi:nitroimidazol reductase NimA-like FMN-containing flavoprotein (pyridoxamine 5'-phosphate oxidase superfamily)